MTRLIIVDESRVRRLSLVFLTQNTAGIEMLGDFQDVAEALPPISSLNPDTVLFDVSSPENDAIAGIGLIRQVNPSVRVIVMANSIDEGIAQQAHQAGAAHVVFRDDFSEAINEILNLLTSETANLGLDIKVSRCKTSTEWKELQPMHWGIPEIVYHPKE